MQKKRSLGKLQEILTEEQKKILNINEAKTAKVEKITFDPYKENFLSPVVVQEVAELVKIVKGSRSQKHKVEIKHDETPGRIRRMTSIGIDDLKKMIETIKYMKTEPGEPKDVTGIFYQILLDLVKGDFLKKKVEMMLFSQEIKHKSHAHFQYLMENNFLENGQPIFTTRLFGTYLQVCHQDKPNMNEVARNMTALLKKIYSEFASWNFLDRYLPKGYGNIGYVYRVNAELVPLIVGLNHAQLRLLNNRIAKIINQIKENEKGMLTQAVKDAEHLGGSAETVETLCPPMPVSEMSSVPSVALDMEAKEKYITEETPVAESISQKPEATEISLPAGKNVLVFEGAMNFVFKSGSFEIKAEGVDKITITPL